MSKTAPDKIKTLQGLKSHINGPVADRMERFFYERINSDSARNEIYREAEDAFKHRIDDESGIHGIWQGEFWGKWMISAAQVCEYSGNEELRRFIHQAALKLIRYQDPDGYLGTYRNPMMVFPADTDVTLKKLGWRCNWNWNIWCHKYTLWGLIEAWKSSGDEQILEAAVRHSDNIIHLLHENHICLAETGTFAGIPSGSILKPMLLLFRETGAQRYLDFAREIVNDWKREDGRIPNLIRNSLNEIPVHEWYPDAPRWAKVYEMLSCFEGILELYKIDGDRDLLEASVNFYKLLKRHELNPLFSVGFNDIFNHAASQNNAISEPCDVIHWIRFCYELFMLTGTKSYLDDIEYAFYNPFLAGVYRDGKWGARGVRGHGRHYTALEQAKFVRNHCCVNNVPRGFINMTQAMAVTSGNTVYVNFYTGFTTEFMRNDRKISISVSGDYLNTGKVSLHFNTELSHPLQLKLRIPSWAVTAQMTRGAEVYESKDAEWFDTSLEPGETEITLLFTRRLEIRSHLPSSENTDWFESRWESQDHEMKGMFIKDERKSLVYGPLLLARSKYIGSSEEEMFSTCASPDFSCGLSPAKAENTICLFDADLRTGDQTAKLKLCDYASAGNELHLDDNRFFSIYF